MAGTIALTPDVRWHIKRSLFFWVIEALAVLVDDPPTREQLREVSEANVGWLGLHDLPAEVRQQLLDTIRVDLVPYAEQHLPETPYRPAVVAMLGELAALADGVG